MAAFVIEGTVSKIIISDNHDVRFTVCGLEGYSIKHEDKKFNILCSEDLLKGSQDDNKPQVGIILSIDYEFSFENVIENSLVLSNSLGKHIKLKFEIDENKPFSDFYKKDIAEPSSITLLAD